MYLPWASWSACSREQRRRRTWGRACRGRAARGSCWTRARPTTAALGPSGSAPSFGLGASERPGLRRGSRAQQKAHTLRKKIFALVGKEGFSEHRRGNGSAGWPRGTRAGKENSAHRAQVSIWPCLPSSSWRMPWTRLSRREKRVGIRLGSDLDGASSSCLRRPRQNQRARGSPLRC